ncbi:MAG: Asp-tRNA(Asn)/Glu-tRNA(Gln) amidotransferase subunit GatA [Bacilli bacterium]|nr:Asp-tRNA(Asn)/Glu-tRNA(Gln) amidotransferase subunit GatA [Bacilli bacterium]
MSKYLDLNIKEINELLKKKEIKVSDLVKEAIERIENSDLNAFITLCKEEALKKAEELDDKEVDNLLFGIPIAIKDNIVTKNIKTTAGSLMLNNFNPTYNADVVELINEKNMVIIGKTNMDEFAMGSSNQTSYFGPVKNPWNKTKVPGGSSGGNAACISSRLVPFALGSDTGGSIRQPSAFCGTVGLKPTYGRVSRYGLIAFASSLDQIGPMTRNVYENALLLNAICKKSKNDLTSSDTNEDFTRLIGEDIKGMKIGIPKFYISDVIDKDILDKFKEIVSLLEEKGATIDYVDIDYIDKCVPLYQIIALGEASSNLARFDGIRYGYAAKDIDNIDDLYYKTRSQGFGEEVKRRIMVGSYLLSGENVDVYYNNALRIRNAMRNSFLDKFNSYDLLIGPTTTTVAYDLNSDLDDPNKSFMDDVLTIPVNMAGLPAMSLPIGFSNDLPIGMQIIGKPEDEALIYKLGSFIEKELSLDLDPRGDKDE